MWFLPVHTQAHTHTQNLCMCMYEYKLNKCQTNEKHFPAMEM